MTRERKSSPELLAAANFVTVFVMLLVVGLGMRSLLQWRPQARVLYQAWGWAESCTAGVPKALKNPHGDLDHIVWATFQPGAFDDTLPGHVIGMTARYDGVDTDSIYIDTEHEDSVWVLAHELVHHILGDSLGGSHPFVPFAFPCHLFEWQQGPNPIGILGQGSRRRSP